MKRFLILVVVALPVVVGMMVYQSRKRAYTEKVATQPVAEIAPEPQAIIASPASEAELKEIIEIVDFTQRTDAFRAYFSDLCRRDSAAAADIIIRVDARFRDYGAVELVARALAAVNIPAALAFADRIDSARQADLIREIALTEWGSKDPEAAANHVLEKISSSQQGRALANFAVKWAKQNPSGAMGFASRISDPSARASFYASVLDGWSSRHPAAAARALSELEGTEVPRAAFANIVARNWSEFSPEASAAWANTLGENDPARGAALNPSIAKWTASDPAAVSRFLSAMPRSRSRDEAVAVFVSGAVAIDPEAATWWAKAIDRHDIRQSAYQSAANHFGQLDPAEGQAWINSLGDLPPAWVEDLLRRMNRDGASQVVSGK